MMKLQLFFKRTLSAMIDLLKIAWGNKDYIALIHE